MKKKSLSMNQIMILSLTAIVVGILGCAIAFFLRTYQQSLIRNAQTDGRRTISQVTSTVDSYLGDMNNVMEILASELVTPSEDREHFFDTFLKIRPDVVAVTIYDETGHLMSCYSLDHEVRPVVLENLSFDRTMLDIYQEGYVSAPHVMSLFEGYYPWVVTIIRPVDAGKWEKWVAVDISCSNISSYINGIGIGQRGYCFLEDMQGNIVYHPQQQLIYSDLKQENTALISSLDDGSHVIGTMIYTVQTLTSGNWRVVGVSFVQDIITDSLREIAQLLGAAAIAIVAATLAVSVLFSRVLSRPIHDLISAMEAFEKNADNFVYEPVSGVREVQDLSSSFAHLVRKIQQLMATVRAEEVNLRKTELRALQAQINPHFLYNTLDSISWMCEQGKNKDAVVMVNALAQLFRISISKGHELIPIRSEVQHAKSYLQIQSVRYKDQFSYRFEVDESCLDYLCNKITLQPIIENAIYHGINGLVDEGEIIIRGATIFLRPSRTTASAWSRNRSRRFSAAAIQSPASASRTSTTGSRSGSATLTASRLKASPTAARASWCACPKSRRSETMKRRMLALFLALFLGIALTGCADVQSNNGPYKMYLIAKSTTTEFWKSVFAGANAAKSEYNVDLTVLGPDTEENYEAQNEYIRQAVADGADAIVFSAISYAKNAQAIDEAADAGVKVVVIDSDVNSSGVVARIGTDNVKAGRMSAKAALDTEELDSIVVGIVNCDVETQNCQERERGFRVALAADPRVQDIYTVNVPTDAELARQAARGLLLEHPDINVLVGFNEPLAVGTAMAVDELELNGQVREIAFDTNPVCVELLQKGAVSALIVQNPYAMGYLGVETAWRSLQGERFDASSLINTPTTTITRETMFTIESQKAIFSFD